MTSKTSATAPRQIAVIGAGMAGIACARTLAQAGHNVSVFDKSRGVAGRMATRSTSFGTFDHGAQYFTVRDPRFALALETAKGVSKPWSANSVRVLDTFGRVAAAALPSREPHWVPAPGMSALVKHWAKPLVEDGRVELETQVTRIERDPLNKKQWQLRTTGMPGAPDAQHVFSGFDAVILAMPHPQVQNLLQNSAQAARLVRDIHHVQVAPCWTLMLAFPQAIQPNMAHLGPQWNAARSTHHRISWLARESSKPGRGGVERWTVQAGVAWSLEHLEDDAARVQSKLLKAFTEVTGIRAEPAHAAVHRWRYAQTVQPLGRSHLWDEKSNIGACGDWCIGHRVEDAFISGLEMALAIA
ncbi:putative NAD/FAD-dependent oxidoreductase [Rhodoferax ferrireducens]|uniref:NAD/FAD-dependent oxidoreductase n=1 Tax=Rhodoferax ferrireducens TaxID=192843 RepID=A0ABU2CAP7_9BURK|nr:FAD-dependent oxidoreductase [Rhodoferax ferrireducens]MDR7378386.1 putative NAD/FAD-dependent oxidoreductase [Rhodoferax ferrireducens]